MTRFLTHWFVWLGLSLALICIPLLGANAAVCGPRDHLLAQIESQLGETPFGNGVQHGGKATAELLLSTATGSWTVILTGPDDLSCIIAGGDSWSFSMPEEKGDGL